MAQRQRGRREGQGPGERLRQCELPTAGAEAGA